MSRLLSIIAPRSRGVRAFDGPGLGAEIDFDLIEATTVEVLT